MEVVSLRRYPVKSMGGEALESTLIDERGLHGDRWYAVEDGEGHFASGKDTRRFRRRDTVFDYAARTVGDEVEVSGLGGVWLAGDPALDAALSSRMSAAVRVLPEGDVPHHDAAAVSLVGTATLEWCARQWGIDADPRRLRVNVVIETSEPFVEETWVGRGIGVGTVGLEVTQRVERCRMIDIDQDGVLAQGGWLKPLGAEREVCVAVYASVAQTGTVAVGDSVRVL